MKVEVGYEREVRVEVGLRVGLDKSNIYFW